MVGGIWVIELIDLGEDGFCLCMLAYMLGFWICYRLLNKLGGLGVFAKSYSMWPMTVRYYQ